MSANYALLCYTRAATSREEANNEDIAYSVHLALRSQEIGRASCRERVCLYV